MTDFSQALAQGTSHAWLFIPSAILLGALHGLEPGHSKTMMAAFIIAVRGTITQAVLLGLSAAFSHSLVIWLLAALALKYGSHWNAETTEPYFQLGSGLMVAALALWMLWRTRRDAQAAAAHEREHAEGRAHSHEHGHGQGEHHHHEDETKVVDTGHGIVKLSVFEEGTPPVFRLHADDRSRAFLFEPEGAAIETVRENGTRQKFALAPRDGYLESTTDIPEPHNFDAVLTLGHADHVHTYVLAFREGAHHHDHAESTEFQDAHEAAHAREIEQRFAGRKVTTGQIVLFGLTGGLLPCPAAFTILLICLQVKQFTLGFSMVAAFSVGLAITLVSVGTVAAWSVGHAAKKFSGFGTLMRRAPYLSGVVLLVLAGYMAWSGWRGLASHRPGPPAPERAAIIIPTSAMDLTFTG